MTFRSNDDVDKFFDKFEDPAHEVERIMNAIDIVQFMGDSGVYRYFIKKLIMKAYRLGKDHAYQGSLMTIRHRQKPGGNDV